MQKASNPPQTLGTQGFEGHFKFLMCEFYTFIGSIPIIPDLVIVI